MRKLVFVGSILAVGASVTGSSIVGWPVTASAGTELRFFTHDTHQAVLDLGERGESAGDRLVFSVRAVDRAGGTKVGRLGGVCDTVSRDANGEAETFCVASFDLARGRLTTSLFVDTAAFFGGTPQPFAVTGGTGAYRNARGEGTITVVNATDAKSVVRLD